ncbi:acyl-CoA N-acyltransferase, partial [Amylostereum chailletii]
SPTLPLELRLAIPSDAPAVLDIFTNPVNTEHDPVISDSPTWTLERVQARIAQWTAEASVPLPGRVTLVAAIEGTVEGVGGMGHIATAADGKRTGDAGIMLNKSVRRRGYATEAMRLTIAYALEEMALDAVTVTMLAENVGMVAVMDRMGWVGVRVEEGEFGKPEIMYKITPEQWK